MFEEGWAEADGCFYCSCRRSCKEGFTLARQAEGLSVAVLYGTKSSKENRNTQEVNMKLEESMKQLIFEVSIFLRPGILFAHPGSEEFIGL